MTNISPSQEYKKQTFKRFVELGALTLSVEEFVNIVFPTFINEIEAEVLKIARDLGVANIWTEINNLINNNEFEHPIILAFHKAQLFREIIGPEYSLINRYPRVYEKIYSEILPSMMLNTKPIDGTTTNLATDISIGLIGSSYGQELITTLKYLFPFLSKSEEFLEQRLNIDVLSKPNIIFEKLRRNSVLYPKSVISKYLTPEEVNFYFVDADGENLSFSHFIEQKIGFINLDLLNKNDWELLLHKKYNLILFHNVIQYLEPQKNYNLDFVFLFLDLILKEGGLISIINENKVINRQIIDPFERLYQLGRNYSQQVVHCASLYKKLA